jgi:hypothetical protein
VNFAYLKRVDGGNIGIYVALWIGQGGTKPIVGSDAGVNDPTALDAGDYYLQRGFDTCDWSYTFNITP